MKKLSRSFFFVFTFASIFIIALADDVIILKFFALAFGLIVFSAISFVVFESDEDEKPTEEQKNE
jgi:hypothetical protein